MVTWYDEAVVGTVAPVGHGSDYAIVPVAVLRPWLARRYVRREPKAQRCVTSEYACTQVGQQSRLATVNVKCRCH